MKTSVLISMGLMAILPAYSQSYSEKITRELTFEKRGTNNTIMIFNINGNVKVEGTSGDKVLIEVEKRIDAKTEARLAQGKEEIQLGIMDRADTLMIYTKGICADFGRRTKGDHWEKKFRGWGYNWNAWKRGRNDDCDAKYDYKMNFTIKVPASISVFAATVNNGDVEISKVSGYVLADNINGSIRLKDISGATEAHTINGSVDLDYSGNPPGDSKYYSLNGDINANFKKGLAAQLTFKSFNGDFYSSVDDITPMAVVVEKYEKGEGIRYKVNGNRYKVRQGGPLLDFETFNGDVYLKEKEN